MGVCDVSFPLSINERGGKTQQVVASIKISVDLSNQQKGAHMSRFLEVINNFGAQTVNDGDAVSALLWNTKQALQSESAHAELSFIFFISKEAPVSKKRGLMGYRCILGGQINAADEIALFVKVFVPVSTVCPCSKEISSQGAHNQRGEVALHVTIDYPICLEDLIDVVEKQGSHHVYPLLKRIDEKEVTERMFSNPKFVEDVVRDISLQIQKDPRIKNFHVECTNFESIHQHNIFAKIKSSR